MWEEPPNEEDDDSEGAGEEDLEEEGYGHSEEVKNKEELKKPQVQFKKIANRGEAQSGVKKVQNRHKSHGGASKESNDHDMDILSVKSGDVYYICLSRFDFA